MARVRTIDPTLTRDAVKKSRRVQSGFRLITHRAVPHSRAKNTRFTHVDDRSAHSIEIDRSKLITETELPAIGVFAVFHARDTGNVTSYDNLLLR